MDWKRFPKRWSKHRIDSYIIPPAWIEEQLAEIGCDDHRWSLPGGWFEYDSARFREEI